jgi:hypothetical protein
MRNYKSVWLKIGIGEQTCPYLLSIQQNSVVSQSCARFLSENNATTEETVDMNALFGAFVVT